MGGADEVAHTVLSLIHGTAHVRAEHVAASDAKEV